MGPPALRRCAPRHAACCCAPAAMQGDAGHTAALVIAKVAAIEVPRSEWPELMQGLLANMGAGPLAPAGPRRQPAAVGRAAAWLRLLLPCAMPPPLLAVAREPLPRLLGPLHCTPPMLFPSRC